MSYRNNNHGQQQRRPSTAIARHNATTDLQQIADIVAEHERKNDAIILTPSSSISHIPDDHALVIRKLKFDPQRDFYFTGRDAYALHKGALERIAAAAGIQWDVDRCKRLDDRSHPNYCEYQVVGAGRDPQTGDVVKRKGTKAMDLREGSASCQEIFENHRKKIGTGHKDKYKTEAEADKAAKAEINQLRSNIVERAETGAYLRVIRSATAIRTNYTSMERDKLFILISLVYQPKDPEIRRMHRIQAARAAQDLFCGGGPAMGNAGIIDVMPNAPKPPPELEHDAGFPINVNAPERTGDPEDIEQPRNVVLDTSNPTFIPGLEDFREMDREARVRVAYDAIRLANYDYEGAMASKGKEAPPLEDLPDTWLQALFEACSEMLQPGEERPYSDDEIPF